MGFWRWKKDRKDGSATDADEGPVAAEETPPLEAGHWQRRLERFRCELKYRPDYINSPEVDAELQDNGYVEKREGATPEQIAENERLREEFKKSKLVRFLLRSEELTERRLEEERRRNSTPARREDTKFWRSLPPVPGPYGGPPIPRKALNGQEVVQAKIFDFFKQFQFGLWGYRQRPYPPERPIDVQQALGYKWLDKRYSDFVMRSGGWYYKDRLGRTRGPMELVQLKTAWVGGIIDKNTFIWGDDLDEWAPIGMVYGLQTAICTPDIRIAAAGTALVHKLARGLPPWLPRKGHERKSLKQLQKEALEKRDRENAVLRLNGGVWPGEKAPGHALFLWATGSQITDILDEGQSPYMPDKFIPYDIRKRLAKEIPGLRPWEVVEVEQVWDLVTYNKQWYREDLGYFTQRADYEADWYSQMKEKWDEEAEDIQELFSKPGMPKVDLPKLTPY
ncbi:hypothetical protein O6H91_11G102000 [Diphasiastrum complanatum]|uniref:Uncharacterized protein n=1 Tax=Diphasiastrum complanatum TaxID=34168 RepID=A0ACC2CC58_DIPCM|nr:hypothetical protein O6H91_11G102000 [Diphasiastrum complanatum]